MPTPVKSSQAPAIAGRDAISFRRILVPVDFSEAGRPALVMAMAFARLSGARIRLVHVIEPTAFATPVYGGGGLAYVPFDPVRCREVIARELGALQAGTLEGFRTSFDIRDGIAHREIVAAARAGRCDLIVMATHGLTGIEHALLGSTTERVVRHAHCPVLVVRSAGRKAPRNPKPRRKASPGQ